MFSTWFDLLESVCSFVLPLVCLFEGTRRCTALGISRNSVMLSIFGLIFLLAQLGYGYWTHQFQLNVSEIFRKDIEIPEVPEDWGSELSPEKRHMDSHKIAHMAFLDHGHLYHYFNMSGDRILFTPALADLQERERKVAILAKIELYSENTMAVVVRQALTIGLVIVLGVVFGRSRTKVVNSSLKMDASRKSDEPL